MGITTAMMDGFSNVIRSLKPATKPHILFLGYQDILVSDQYLKTHFGAQSTVLVPRKDSVEVIRHHGINAKLVKTVPTLSSFMKLYGDFEVTVFDFEKVEGSEEIVDLNQPIEEKYKHRFDIIIDTGTIEHVFQHRRSDQKHCRSDQERRAGVAWFSSTLFQSWFLQPKPHILRRLLFAEWVRDSRSVCQFSSRWRDHQASG